MLTYKNIAKCDFITDCEIAAQLHYPDVIFFGCKFDTALFCENQAQKLSIELPESIVPAVSKRKAEFVAGRFCANICLDIYGLPIKEIKIGKNRSPIWPDGIIASISHTNDFCVCAATKNQNFLGIGIDIESILGTDQAADLQNQIISLQELAVGRQQGIETALFVTLAFSAKESLFKALHRQVGRYFDFTAAEVIDIDVEKNLLTLVIRETLSCDITPGKQYICLFYYFENKIITFIPVARD